MQRQLERRLESATNPATPPAYRLHVVALRQLQLIASRRAWCMVVFCASEMENLLSEMEWTNDQVISLIELFRERPVLWNQTISEFKNKNLKNYAWNEISQEMKVSKSEVQSKMRNLITTFQRIFKKEKSGSGASSKSKWFAFDHLMFLKDKTTPTFSRDAGINDTQAQVRKLYLQ